MIRTALSVIREATLSLSAFVYPPQCPLCRSVLTEDQFTVCDRCLARMETRGEKGDNADGVHSPENYPYSRIKALYVYDEPTRSIIHQYKYLAKKSLALPLGRRLARFIAEEMPSAPSDEQCIVVPVPLNSFKLIIRGYNQSALLAREIGCSLGIPVEENILIRSRYTRTQTALSDVERSENIRGAFRLSRPGYFTGKSVILVDDVITTGSTAGECARVLKEDGCGEVSVFGLAAPRSGGEE